MKGGEIDERRHFCETRQDVQAALGSKKLAALMRNRVKLKTQDGRRLRRHERRWLVERFFAWLQWQRRLLVRWEYYAENFLGFVQLASIAILLKQF